MKITLVLDNQASWMMFYVQKLKKILEIEHQVDFVHNYKDIMPSDCAFFLSCENIAGTEVLERSKHNLVVHASALPKGRGWSPLTWQILEDKNTIPVVLFEAIEKVDQGDIYLQEDIHFQGDELLDELRHTLGEKIIELILKFVKQYPNIKARKQEGEFSYYQRRLPKDSELDINQTIKELFNKLRIVDNMRYPAFFKHKGHKYIIKISKEEPKGIKL